MAKFVSLTKRTMQTPIGRLNNKIILAFTGFNLGPTAMNIFIFVVSSMGSKKRAKFRISSKKLYEELGINNIDKETRERSLISLKTLQYKDIPFFREVSHKRRLWEFTLSEDFQKSVIDTNYKNGNYTTIDLRAFYSLRSKPQKKLYLYLSYRRYKKKLQLEEETLYSQFNLESRFHSRNLTPYIKDTIKKINEIETKFETRVEYDSDDKNYIFHFICKTEGGQANIIKKLKENSIDIQPKSLNKLIDKGLTVNVCDMILKRMDKQNDIKDRNSYFYKSAMKELTETKTKTLEDVLSDEKDKKEFILSCESVIQIYNSTVSDSTNSCHTGIPKNFNDFITNCNAHTPTSEIFKNLMDKFELSEKESHKGLILFQSGKIQ